MNLSVTVKILLTICIVINSNCQHLARGSDKFLNGTEFTNQKHRFKRQLAFQPGTRIMVRHSTILIKLIFYNYNINYNGLKFFISGRAKKNYSLLFFENLL